MKKRREERKREGSKSKQQRHNKAGEAIDSLMNSHAETNMQAR